MGIVFAFLFLILLPAGIAWVLGRMLDNFLPRWSFRRRTLIAALGAGFVPMALPLAIMLVEMGADMDLIPVIALVFVAGLITLLIGLPVAFYSRQDRQEPFGAARTFD
ncbi:MAG: hypothetical protein ABL926_05015 [Novosphingobium sp.]|uniref:hypothetical protein n=1 Tax=Novosphingobium sp. TaxID=1874826 RepID=UPI0032B81BA1